MVLERPEIPLHTNDSENDIRCQVTRRKVSAGTRSDIGRDCRDAFLGLVKTCDKLGIALLDYLGGRFKVAGTQSLSRSTITSEPGSAQPDWRKAHYLVRVIYLVAGLREHTVPQCPWYCPNYRVTLRRRRGRKRIAMDKDDTQPRIIVQ